MFQSFGEVHSLSSGERNGKSPNFFRKKKGLQDSKPGLPERLIHKDFVNRICWKAKPKRVIVP